jgi:UDP-N-acetyl-D-mannosaminuronic acid dehydrogenase
MVNVMSKKMCVLGLGYVGLPTASMFATHGFSVTGVDTNPKIIEGINTGEVHIKEPGLRAFVHDALRTGNLKVQETPEKADIFIICVPTPITGEKKAYLEYVKSASESILPFLEKGCLVVIESTVPPGTTTNVVIPILERTGLKTGRDFYVAYCPERVMPGNILKEMIENDRMIGGIDNSSNLYAKKIYQAFVKGHIYLTDTVTAEFVKLIENTYRDVNIALANELALIAEESEIDVWNAISLANKHPRVNIHRPGPGVGGHCIGVDPYFLVEKSPKHSRLIQLSREINNTMPDHVVELIESSVQSLKKPKITIFGIAYKGNIDDTRESPGLKVVSLLQRKGYKMSIYDPYVGNEKYPSENFDDAVTDSDCIVILADHKEFQNIDLEDLVQKMRNKIVIDTKNYIDHEEWSKKGFEIVLLGKSS